MPGKCLKNNYWLFSSNSTVMGRGLAHRVPARWAASVVRHKIVVDLASAPGGKAGLRPGDEFISYNGERTFSMMDLRNLAFSGEAGENAIIEIDRDGVRMQLSIPRGPIGMNGNGASVRTMNWWGG